MKKYIYRIFLIIIFVFLVDTLCNSVKAWTLCNIPYNSLKDFTDSTEQVDLYGHPTKVIDIINSYLRDDVQPYDSYTGNNPPKHPLTNPLIVRSNVIITFANSAFAGEYKVAVGRGWRTLGETFSMDEGHNYYQNDNDLGNLDINGERYFTYDQLCEQLGCNIPKEQIQQNTTWDIVIKASVTTEGIGGDEVFDLVADATGAYKTYKLYKIEVEKLWNEEDFENEVKNGKEKSQEDLWADSSSYVKIYDKADPIDEGHIAPGKLDSDNEPPGFWDFINHPKESIITVLLDLIKVVFGDTPQMLANTAQTGLRTWKIMYDYESFENKYSDLAKYVGYRDYHTLDESHQHKITIDKHVNEASKSGDKGEEYGFNLKSRIPVITVDLYTMVANKVDLVKTNFFKVNGDEMDAWLLIRNFVASLIHAAMYLVAAILIVGLIINGIYLVSHSFISPQKKKERTEAMQRFALGVLMLFGTLIIEAICIFSSDLILGDTSIDNTYEGPLRVVVTGVYRFSTCPTGYLRYMADIENIQLYQEKAVYVVEYILMAWSNLIVLVAMVGRMLIMMVLSVVGFIIVLKNVTNSKSVGTSGYKTWIISYASIAAMQIVLALIARFIIESITAELM